jgi:phage FluMu protein Com
MQKPSASTPTRRPSPGSSVPASTASQRDLRCDCGKLLARVLPSVLELKCSRCKQVMLIVGGRRFEATGARSCTCGAVPPASV